MPLWRPNPLQGAVFSLVHLITTTLVNYWHGLACVVLFWSGVGVDLGVWALDVETALRFQSQRANRPLVEHV